MFSCRQVGCEAFESLDAGTFVIAVKVFGRVKIAVDNMPHLREEIRIGDLQVVLATVGLEDMLGENALYGGPTDGSVDILGVFFEIAVSIAQGPSKDSRQGRAFLAINSDSHKAR